MDYEKIKSYSEEDLNRLVLFPTKTILEEKYPTTHENMVGYYSQVELMLRLNENELTALKAIISIKEYNKKQDFLRLIDTLEKNINRLQAIITKHKESVQNEIAKIDVLAIKEQIKNEQDADTIISNIKFSFHDVVRDLYYGKCIRRIMLGLTEMSNNVDWKSLDNYNCECEQEIEAVKQQIIANKKWKIRHQLELDVIQKSLEYTSKLIKLYKKNLSSAFECLCICKKY